TAPKASLGSLRPAGRARRNPAIPATPPGFPLVLALRSSPGLVVWSRVPRPGPVLGPGQAGDRPRLPAAVTGLPAVAGGILRHLAREHGLGHGPHGHPAVHRGLLDPAERLRLREPAPRLQAALGPVQDLAHL